MIDAPPAAPLFDAGVFARKLGRAVAGVGGTREAARLAGVSPATISRGCHGWPTMSHESVLRLEAWMRSLKETT